jgi:hypothetical protein
MSTIQDHCGRVVIKAWGRVLLFAFSQIVSKVVLSVKGQQRAQTGYWPSAFEWPLLRKKVNRSNRECDETELWC